MNPHHPGGAGARARGAANLALIKYMGKRDAATNTPHNPSLSLTLPHLVSTVSVSDAAGESDRWQYLPGDGDAGLRLTADGQRRFLAHVRRLCDRWDHRRRVLVRSANNFPADAGLASSASSFCAATRAVAAFLRRDETAADLAQLSRAGSGSSCRSFFVPWCLWDGDAIGALDFPLDPLLHMVVIVDGGRKQVSSSEAHARVVTSPRFAGRADRARRRLSDLVQALKASDWRSACEISSAEYLDMHQLFATSDPPFGYREPPSDAIAAECATHWSRHGDGPLLTMDAGPNVHLLFRQDQRDLLLRLAERYSRSHRVLSSEPETAWTTSAR